MLGGERLFQQIFCLIKIWLHKQRERERKRKREAHLWLNHKCFNNPIFPHSDLIPLNQRWLSFIAVQLIGLILASVSLKAECICPTATPKGRKDNTSKPAAQLLADFKEILGDYVPLRCLSPVTAKVTRVTLTAVLFMLLDFLLLKPFGALLFAPHLLTTNTRINGKHTHGLTSTNDEICLYVCRHKSSAYSMYVQNTNTVYTHAHTHTHLNSEGIYFYFILFYLFLCIV